MSVNTSFQYQEEVVRTDDGVAFGRRDVPQSYLESAREQVIFDAQRRGLLGADPNGVRVVDEPAFVAGGSEQINGVTMAVGDGAQRLQRKFGIELFEPFASLITAHLLQAEQLTADDHVAYRVFARPTSPAQAADGVVARVCREPLKLSAGRLDDWLAVAQAEGPVNASDYPIFLLEKEVLEQARTFSWKGREKEGGSWLIGNVFEQVQPRHEIFGVIHTPLQAYGMKHDRFGLELSSETFTRLQAQMDRRRKRFGRVGELEMGFYHTHPFLPSELHGKDACTSCDKLAECNLSSASVFSKQDAQFHAAIFGRAPYAIEFVLGLTPRAEFDLQAYCLDGGQFRRRGFYRVTQPPPGVLDDLK